MEEVLLSFITLPALEEPLIDWLLEREDISGFSSSRISGHGSQHAHMNLGEKVMGRQQQILVQVQTSQSTAEALIRDLENDFRGTDIHYWIVPVLAAGHLK